MTHDAAKVCRGQVVGGQYELERILGQGGMGTVWCARDLRLGRSVAIKFLGASSTANASQRERFAREARLVARIRSPHVAQVFAVGATSSGVPYVVMELLDGENLATYIAREKRCGLEQTASILEQLCRALGVAHAAALVHRDIKPANIFLTPQPDGGMFVRLLDFGIAKDLGQAPHNLTKSGEVLGTGYYMSPEQLRSPHIVGAPTDIWALGVVLYEMLTGRVPFDADTFPGLVLRVVEGTFPPPSKLRPELPPAIDHLIACALQLDPSARFASVQDLYAAFMRIVRANTSETVIKPDVVRVLRGNGDTTQRVPRRQRIQDFTTKLFRRDAAGFQRAVVALMLLAAVALGVALLRWADPEAFESALQPLWAAPGALGLEDERSAPVQPASESSSAAASDGEEPVLETPPPAAVNDLPPAAAPTRVVPPAPPAASGAAQLQPGAAAAGRPQRVRRKRASSGPKPETHGAAVPTPAAPTDEMKYGF